MGKCSKPSHFGTPDVLFLRPTMKSIMLFLTLTTSLVSLCLPLTSHKLCLDSKTSSPACSLREVLVSPAHLPHHLPVIGTIPPRAQSTRRGYARES